MLGHLKDQKRAERFARKGGGGGGNNVLHAGEECSMISTVKGVCVGKLQFPEGKGKRGDLKRRDTPRR